MEMIVDNNMTTTSTKNFVVHPSTVTSGASTTMSSSTQKKKKKNIILAERQQQVPIFLRKTFQMMNTCDTNIASWSDDGTMIVIKDTEKFASGVIPQFFKHNNLSSFVRQLNFYGFRKLRNTPHYEDDDEDDHTSRYWFFHHNNFLRDRPDLLCKIRKTTPNSSNNHSGNTTANADVEAALTTQRDLEVENLKSEVGTLKSCIAKMSNDMKNLSFVVQNMYHQNEKRDRAQEEEDSQYIDNYEPPTKKVMMKTSVPDVHMLIKPLLPRLPEETTTTTQTMMMNNSTTADDFVNPLIASDSDLLVEEEPTTTMCVSDVMNNNMKKKKNQSTSSHHHHARTFSSLSALSFGSISEMNDADFITSDEQDFDRLGVEISHGNDDGNYSTIKKSNDDDEMDPTTTHHPSSSSMMMMTSSFEQQPGASQHINPNLLHKLHYSLAILPKEMQESLIEKIIQSIANHFNPTTTTTNEHQSFCYSNKDR